MTERGPHVTNLFETPVIFDRLPDHDGLNGQLREMITRRRAGDPGVVRSNANGWQSGPDMLRWGGDPALAVARHFIGLCDRYTGDPRPPAPGEGRYAWTLDLWANVNPPGASNNYHNHPGAVWSAVYYVDAGSGGNMGGELVFQDPRMPTTRMLPFDLRYRKPDGSLYDEEEVVEPRTGTMVMFPPWLLHSVRPYRGTGERISLAMNATVSPAPPGGRG